ncbi:rRNA-processing protein EFG1 isoform X1 [Tripterygium wilfordii]|uniref:rRNA-processing protein EFG1 n=1 Tax=Tripterygium wilfordii TaxID=458696 RepID=A0A7J7E128_TRIWF|nr:rRNA-processing protein EFG1 isoform X1 [Tripterygium wilfordii]KAF5752350.1 rRNA-processing protein EFG1 isoform X1 [Tripterygium wilfordii]
MAHGGYGKRRVAERKKPLGRRGGVEKKSKSVSFKNQIRSIQRLLRKDLPPEVREAQEKKLAGIKKQHEIHSHLGKIFRRDLRIKFHERRKIERRIRRLEKLQRTSSGQGQDAELADQLSKLKEDLEYVRFFPKNEKYVSLFTGGDDLDIVDRRNKLRKQIKANLIGAAASGKDLEETGSEDDGLLESEDDFFVTGSSSDEADADDEWTDKSTREQASSTSGKAASGMSSDERNQRQISARALMPPPRSSSNSFANSARPLSRFGPSSSRNSSIRRAEVSTTGNASNSRSGSSFRAGGSSSSRTSHSSNLSSNSDAHKPRRKRRPKKKKQQG